MKSSETGPEAWAAQERLRFIERALWWRGRVKRKELREGFGISLAHASADLQRYFEINGTAARYDLRAKCYRGLPEMKCVLHEPRLEEAMAMYLGGGSGAVAATVAMTGSSDESARVARVALPGRDAPAPVQRAVFQAVLFGLRLRMDYGSLTGRRKPGWRWRWICPHAFAHDGYRWHVRAWCEENGDYRDFVLSRIRNCEPPEEEPVGELPADAEWDAWEELRLTANPKLPADQRAAIEADFGMRSGRITLRVRKAMCGYTLAHLRLPTTGGNSPEPFLRLDSE